MYNSGTLLSIFYKSIVCLFWSCRIILSPRIKYIKCFGPIVNCFPFKTNLCIYDSPGFMVNSFTSLGFLSCGILYIKCSAGPPTVAHPTILVAWSSQAISGQISSSCLPPLYLFHCVPNVRFSCGRSTRKRRAVSCKR